MRCHGKKFIMFVRPVLIVCVLIAAVSTAISQESKTDLSKVEDKLGTTAIFDGKSLEGWKVIDKFVFKRHGKVSVKEGEMILEKGGAGTGIVWQGKMPRINYEIRLEAKRIEGSDFFCGLTFPVNDDYCTLILGGWGGGATGLSNLDDFAAIENQTSNFVEFKNGQYYPIRLRVSGKKIEAWVADKKIVDVDHTEHRLSIWWEQEPARPLGIATWYTSAAFKKVELERLTAKGEPTENEATENKE